MDYSQFYIQEFKKYIALQTSSINTIKNYLSDLRLFLSFISQKGDQPLSPQSLPTYISEDFITQYESYLSLANPPATTKRRVSSLKKFIDYCRTQGILPVPPQPATPTPYSYPEPVPAPLPQEPVVVPAPMPEPPPVIPAYYATPPTPTPPTPPPPTPTIVPPPFSIPPAAPIAHQAPPPQNSEPLNFYQPAHQPVMSQSPFSPAPQSSTPTPPPSTTANLVHSFESLLPDLPAPTPAAVTTDYYKPVETDYSIRQESESVRSRRTSAKKSEFLSYIIVSLISFLICMGLTLFITLVLLK